MVSLPRSPNFSNIISLVTVEIAKVYLHPAPIPSNDLEIPNHLCIANQAPNFLVYHITMAPITLHSAPPLDSFITLQEYQSRTPASFFDGPPILHYHSANARAIARRSQLPKLPFFAQVTEASTEEVADDDVVEQLEIFVSSEYVRFASL